MAGRGKLRKTGAIVAASAMVLSMIAGLLAIGAGVASAAAVVSGITLSPPGAAPASVLQGGANTTPDLTFTITGAALGDRLAIDIAPPGLTTNPTDATRQVSLSGTPGVFEAVPPIGQTGPQFSVALGHNPSDAPGVAAGLTDELDLTVSAPATDASTYTVYVGLSPAGVVTPVPSSLPAVVGPTALSVNATADAALGAVNTAATYNGAVLTIPSIANIVTGQVTANSPAIAIPDIGATGFPISPVVYREAAPGELGAGATAAAPVTVSLTLTAPVVGGTVASLQFNLASTPVVTVSAGSAAAVGPASVAVVGGVGVVQFKVFSPSVLAPAAYTISGLEVDAHPVAGFLLPDGPMDATLTQSSGVAVPGAAGAFEVAGITAVPPSIAGATVDGTADAVLDARFPHTDGPASCVPGGAVVLARDDFFADALSAASLAKFLGTGILLTPGGSLSPQTQTELKNQGVSTVYIVGGPLAITPAVETAIDNLPVFNCGGTSIALQNTKVVTIRVFGQTAAGTAAAVAEFPTPLPTANFIDLSAAFAHATTYNNTGGAETTAPGIAENTAIVTSVARFPDAVAGSTLSYHNGIPILLTDPASLSPEATGGLLADGIKQVILLGGPLAVSDAVEGQLAGMGLSVLRIAGADATDTAQLLAQFEVDTTALGFVGPGPGGIFGGSPTVYISRGDFYGDALTASSFLGSVFIAQPMLLTVNSSTLGTPLTNYLNAAGAAGATTARAFGGPLAVTPATISAADAAIAAR